MSIKYIQDDNGNFYTDANGNLLTVDVSGEGGGQMLYRHDITLYESGSDRFDMGITIINTSSAAIDTVESVKNTVGLGKTINATGSYYGSSEGAVRSITFFDNYMTVNYGLGNERSDDYTSVDATINDTITEIGVAGGGSTTPLFSEWTTGTAGNLYLPSAGLYEIKVVVLEYDEPRTMTFFVDWDGSSYSYSQGSLYEISSNDSTSIISVDDTGLLDYYNTDNAFDTDNVQSISYRKVNEQISAGGSSGGGASSNDGMPTIRLVTVRDTDGSMVISVDNPLTFTVEITSGSLQVGDQLQICSKELYTYRGCSQKRYKLRRFAEYVVAESDLDKTTLYLTIAGANSKHPNLEIERLCRGGGINQSCRRYPKYIRLRRTLYHKDNGEEWSASFSNAIQLNVYGRYDRDNESTNGNISIR